MTVPVGHRQTRADHNQSLLKAVSVLRCFVDSPHGLTLTELSRRTGISISTTHRLLQTLTYGGILHRTEGSERYVSGPVLLALAGATFATAGYEEALAVLRSLAAETGESASLGIRDAECAVILLSAESTQPLRYGHAVGSRIPLHTLAMGKILLAMGERSIPDTVKSLGPLRPLTSRSIVSTDALETELLTVAAKRFATASEEEHIGVRSLAVPVGGSRGPIRLALSVQGPLGRLKGTRLNELLVILGQAAARLEVLPLFNRLS